MARCSCHSHHMSAPARPRVAAHQTVGEVADRSLRALEILKSFGINHCCGAGLTLAEAAAASGVDLQVLLAALSEPA
jgi:iron-sulfur cluster repair protein YtfE (RIC family)